MYRSSADPSPFPTLLAHPSGDAREVMILHGGEEEERYAKRSYGVAGLRVQDFYRRAGFRPLSFRLETDDWSVMLGKTRPCILHIVSGLNDSQQPRDVCLQTYSSRSKDSSFRIWPSTLGQILERAAPAELSPLVILDIPLDPDDAARQVLLRNYFLAALIESVFVRGALGTGAYERQTAAPALEQLTQILGRRPHMVEMYMDLRQSDRPIFAPALFTCFPDAPAF